MSKSIEKITGDLFGSLFCAYDDVVYLKSVELFSKRLKANKFPLEWFKDKVCLDAGCGNGRYSIALSLFGADKVYGVDLSKQSINDARKRAKKLGITNVKFKIASVEKLPFANKSFDAVIFSGVLHHARDQDAAVTEVSRVLRPGGLLYILVYATGGIRWPLVQVLRPLARKIGFKVMDKVATMVKLSVNKRRTYLDDLFVPLIDFYTWERIRGMLQRHSFNRIKRWSKGRFDHEESLNAYKADLEGFQLLFKTGAHSDTPELLRYRKLFYNGEKLCDACIDYITRIQFAVKNKYISYNEAMEMVIGQGHHRVIAWKGR